MIVNNTLLTAINSPVRTIVAKVELYQDSTLVRTFNHDDYLKSIKIDRVGEDSKFFGFGVCQRINVKLRDMNREIAVTTANSMKIYFNGVNTTPIFYITESHRDELTNELSITAYDLIYDAAAHTVDEIALESYTIREFATACSVLLGANSLLITGVGESETCFDTFYEEGANFDGDESIREALNDVAEATQTIYYVDTANNLVFKRLDKDGEAVYDITKERYIELSSSTNRRLGVVSHATQLGDDVTTSLEVSGSRQFVRDNAFWEMRDDIYVLVENALAAIGGITINQFDCSWRGNPLLEIGDKITLTTKDNDVVTSYVLIDTIEYDGSLSQKTEWQHTNDDSESSDNPSTLGEFLNKTVARVDKVNQEINLAIEKVEGYDEQFVEFGMNLDGVSASVQETQTYVNTTLEGVNGNIETLFNEVDAKMSSEEVAIAIQKKIDDGIDKVTTSTGFTFNQDGLTVSKTGTDISTTITEDGMLIRKQNEELLTANNEGVTAIDLHAKTYLIIGKNSRIEDYNYNRTGVFWIGG